MVGGIIFYVFSPFILLLVKRSAVNVVCIRAILNQLPSISFQSGPGMKAQPAEPLRHCNVSMYSSQFFLFFSFVLC